MVQPHIPMTVGKPVLITRESDASRQVRRLWEAYANRIATNAARAIYGDPILDSLVQAITTESSSPREFHCGSFRRVTERFLHGPAFEGTVNEPVRWFGLPIYQDTKLPEDILELCEMIEGDWYPAMRIELSP